MAEIGTISPQLRRWGGVADLAQGAQAADILVKDCEAYGI